MIPEKYAYIETFGCQMNERDSEIMAQILSEASYQSTTDLPKADLVVVNTCSIRGKAEQKAFSLLGRLKKIKKKNPNLLIAVAGCVAQQEGKKIIKRMPFVDIVLGPQNIYRLADFVNGIHDLPQVQTGLVETYKIPSYLPSFSKDSIKKTGHKAFVTIMQGCNNFCTYCVVPYTRGRETSRKQDEILDEISLLVDNGVKEITLLGQNVNSYGLDFKANEKSTFTDLLHAVANIDGLERLRFTTSNPKDLSDELMRSFAEIDILCPHFHLPVQSGSDQILKRMNRKYKIDSYLEKVEKMRGYVPEIAITTDIIVGFPGETDDDFEATIKLLEKVRYHGAYSFKYSDRPHTRSAEFPDKIQEKIKAARLSRLQKLQERFTLERNREYIGQTMDIMIEGESKSVEGQLSGRTSTNHIVNFPAGPFPAVFKPGQVIRVTIEEACLHSLRGKIKND